LELTFYKKIDFHFKNVSKGCSLGISAFPNKIELDFQKHKIEAVKSQRGNTSEIPNVITK